MNRLNFEVEGSKREDIEKGAVLVADQFFGYTPKLKDADNVFFDNPEPRPYTIVGMEVESVMQIATQFGAAYGMSFRAIVTVVWD